MGRSSFYDASGMKRGPWTAEEDQKLLKYIQQHGHGSWSSLPHKAGLKRCGKSCRLRWINYLNPDIKRGNFSLNEEQTIIQLHALLGNRWSTIAMHLPKRTDNEIKNHWNTHIKKRLAGTGIDPNTHKPISKMATTKNDNGDPKKGSKLSHMAQWESARLEAEARSVKESKLRQNVTNTTINIAPCLDVVKAWQKFIAGGEFGFTRGNYEIESPEFNLKFPEKLINNYNGDYHQNEEDETVEVACNNSTRGFGDQNFTRGDINGILEIADEIYGGGVVDQDISNCYWSYIQMIEGPIFL